MVKKYGPWRIKESLSGGGQADIFIVTDGKNDFVLKKYRNIKRIGRIKQEILYTRNLYSLGAPVPRIIDDWEKYGKKSKPWFVTDYYKHGNLRNFINNREECVYPSCIDVIEKIYLAIMKIHKYNYTHRDLKPENILLDEKKKIILCDFGLSFFIDQRGDRLSNTYEIIGSRHYFPKEAFGGPIPQNENQKAIDYYSFGKIFFEILTGVLIPGFDTVNGKYETILDSIKEIPKKIRFYLKNLFNGLLSDSPELRKETWGNIEFIFVLIRDEKIIKSEDSFERLKVKIQERKMSLIKKEKENIIKDKTIEQWLNEVSIHIYNYIKDSRCAIFIQEDYLNIFDKATIELSYTQVQFIERLEGAYINSHSGIQPLRDYGWKKTLKSQELIFGINHNKSKKFDSCWLGLILFKEDDHAKILSFVMKKVAHSGFIDIDTNSIKVRKISYNESIGIENLKKEIEDYFKTITSTMEKNLEE